MFFIGAKSIIIYCMSEEELVDIPLLLGQNIRKFRKMAGLTQSQLYERLEITQKHLSVIETGAQFASAPLIARICKELSVTPGMLFGGDMGSRHLAILQSMIHNLMNAKLETLYQRLHAEIQSLRQEPPRSY